MFTFTRKTDYALVALSRLNQSITPKEGEAQEAAPVRLSARAIAEEFDLPLPLLMNILKELQKAQIITSTRGAHGGYCLAVPAEELSILNIIEAIEGPLALTLCCQPETLYKEGQSKCLVNSLGCPVQNGLRKLHDKMVDFLRETSLQDLQSDPSANQACGCSIEDGQNTVESPAILSTSAAPLS